MDGWTDTYRGYKTHMRAHKHTSKYINTAYKKGKKNFKNYSEKKYFNTK